MPRGSREINSTVKAVLTDAEKDLWLAWKKALNFKNPGIRGSEREEAVREFLRERLPRTYSVVTGEAVDYANTRTTQLDAIIYDSVRNCPILAESEQVLLPAESLLSIVEVKSLLTFDELKKCFEAAVAMRSLKPFKKSFVGARADGAPADKNHRCLYNVFAYESNLGTSQWLSKEWERIQAAAADVGCDYKIIDRIIILNRGMINPGTKTGKVSDSGDAAILHEWFLNLANFVSRENSRRPPVDWQMYSTRTSHDWKKL